MLENIIAGTLSALISGFLLALSFFLLKEKAFGIPNLTGKWYFETKTINTEYNPYKGMTLRYIVVIWREGNKLSGSVEKIYENSSTGEREYVGKNRSHGELNGFYEKNYFMKDKIYIHTKEKGKGRESTNYFDLTRSNNNTLIGTFNSFIANQDGTTVWQREKF